MTSATAVARTGRMSNDKRHSPLLPTQREVELGGIIDAYNRVTEKLKGSHEALTLEIRRLRERLAEQDRELERKERLAALGKRCQEPF